jgi:hypothetical protein
VDLNQEQLKSVLRYDPMTGLFTWLSDVRTGRGNGRVQIPAGTVAGATANKTKGYLKIGVNGRRYYAHRLAFLWMTGAWPNLHVDHIDGDGSNNRWANLRDVSRSVNLQNRKAATAKNTNQLLGVTKNHKRFMAQISTAGCWKYLGTYDTPEQAHEAYIKAKRESHEGNTL